MLGQVGNWDGEIAVHLGEDLLAWLKDYGTEHVVVSTASVRDSVNFDRSITLLPATEDEPCAYRVSFHPGNRLQRGLSVPHGVVPGLADLRLPRFELHEVEFVEGAFGGPAGALLGRDHELPWPRLRRECALYSCPEVFKAELIQRMRSALSVGQRGFLPAQRPPQRLIDTLRKGEWMDCMMEAGALRLAA